MLLVIANYSCKDRVIYTTLLMKKIFKEIIVLSVYFLYFSLAVFFIIASFPPSTTGNVTYHISPAGNDSNSGKSINAPFKTIQKAVDLAQPGDTISLANGEYFQDITSKRNGALAFPIIIKGSSNAILKGGEKGRIVEINHDYHVLDGFTIDGLSGDYAKPDGYKDILIMALGKEIRNGVEGLKIIKMTLKNAGGECIRLRYFATKIEIAYNTIIRCGVRDFVFNQGGKNGEGIYIGTSNKQWGDGKNPTKDPDESNDNIVHHNYIDTQGNECVDIKEGATANIIEYNDCRGQKDLESGGFDSRGDENIFRYNTIKANTGAGVRLGGAKINGHQYGKNNDVYENTILDNQGGGIKFQAYPQGTICGNEMFNNGSLGNTTGDFVLQFNPDRSCPINAALQIESQKNILLIAQDLLQGMYNTDVENLQKFLAKDKTIYPEGFVTGYFGPLTKKAVQRFQCRYDIACGENKSTLEYGIVGEKTREKLNELLRVNGN